MVNLDESLKLEQRTVIGKGLGGLRREGLVPAVIHNHGQPSVHVMGVEKELGKVYQAAGKHHPLNLQVGSDSYLALIKDVHFNPAKHRMQHVVFQAIKQDEAVEAEIPLHLEGEVPAEKVGLMVLHQLDHVEVEALPRDLPDKIIVDVTKLAELHDKISAGDLVMPAGVTLLTDPEHPVATVVETKAQISEEEETAEVQLDADGNPIEAEAAEGEAVEGGESSDKPATADKQDEKQN